MSELGRWLSIGQVSPDSRHRDFTSVYYEIFCGSEIQPKCVMINIFIYIFFHLMNQCIYELAYVRSRGQNLKKKRKLNRVQFNIKITRRKKKKG